MNTTKRTYEAMYIVDSALSEQAVESIVSKYSQLVTDQGGSLTAAGRWDKRRLAYEIQGKREGTYILMVFEGPPAVATELDRVFRISDEVLRFLITRIEPEHVDVSRIGQPTSEEVGIEELEAAEEEVSEVAVADETDQTVEEPALETTAEEPTESTEQTPGDEAAVEQAEIEEAGEAPRDATATEDVEQPVAEAEAQEHSAEVGEEDS